MSKLKIFVGSLLLLGVFLNPIMVLASDISSAVYSGTITISNNGTAANEVSTVMTLNSSDLINNYGVTDNFSNLAILTSAGNDAVYMPSVNSSYPWALWVPSMLADSYVNYQFYIGSEDMESTKYYFPGDAGMTVPDDATLEISDNGSIEVSGYIDTSVSGNITYKEGAYNISSDGSGNITAGVAPATTASDSLKYSNDTEATTSNTVYVLLKEITVTEDIVEARIKFDLRGTASHSGFGKVYKNGVAIGTEQEDSDAVYTTYTEDIVLNASSGDDIQVYGHAQTPDDVGVKNFRIYFDYDYDNIYVTASGVSSGNQTLEMVITDEVDTIISNTSGENRDASVRGASWEGQTFTVASDVLVGSIEVRGSKDNSPGDMTLAIRATSGGLATGSDLTSGTLTEADMSAGVDWNGANVTAPIQLQAGTVYAIVVRCPSGGGINRFLLKYREPGLASNGQRIYSADSGSSWTADSGNDSAYRLKTPMGMSVYIDGEFEGATGPTHIVVPDNDNDIVFFTDDVMPYVEYAEISVGGVQAGYWSWEYGETFTDQSGNGNTATPSFRTASSDADVSASLVRFAPISTAKAPSYSVSSPSDFYSENITTESEFTTSNITASGVPGESIIDDVADSSGTPSIWLWGIIGGFTIALSGLAISWMERQFGGGGGTLLLRFGVVTVLIGLFVAFDIYDFWMMALFIMIALMPLVASRHSEIGAFVGELNTIGFLASSFLGLTLINNILAKELIMADDIGVFNDIMFTQTFQIYDLFSMPIINFGFFTDGVPNMLRWDYTFFGGNAQLITYFLYSITAVVALIIFMMAVGTITSFFARR